MNTMHPGHEVVHLLDEYATRAAFGQVARDAKFLLHVAILAYGIAAFSAVLSGAPIVLGRYGVGAQGVGLCTMLMLLGLGHGLLMQASLSGTVGLVRGLAGSAAAVAGLMQQLMGVTAGFAVGLLPLDGSLYLGWLMLGLSLLAAAAQLVLRRR